jgi:hypothetical protein
MSTATQLRSYTYDADLSLKAAGLIAADTAHTIVAVGDAVFKGVAVIDVSAIEIASNDERYIIHVQGSTSATFASDVQNLVAVELGATEVRSGGAIDSLTGRYEVPFINEQDGICYPYIRLYTDVSGTIATGINFSAFIGRDHLTNA